MPKNPVGYLKMGQSRKMQQKPGEAAKYFAQAMEKNPKDLTAVNEFIVALAAAKDIGKAISTLDEDIGKEPKNPLIWEMAGRFHTAGRNPAEAEKAFLKAIELAPDFTRPYYELGVIYVTQKKLPEAEEKFRKVLEKDDKNIGGHTLLGVVLNSQGKIEEANKHYRRVLELSPKNPLAANNLAANLSDHGGNPPQAPQTP